MIEVQKNIYCLDITFIDHSLSGIKPYLIKGKKGERNLLIETALNTDECYSQLIEQLNELGISLEETDIVISHMHVDHCGLIGRLKCENNKIYTSVEDKNYIEEYKKPNDQWGWLVGNIKWTGTPESVALKPSNHVAAKYCPKGDIEIETLNMGDVLQYGGYKLEVIDLAGHSSAHIGLFEAEQGILFCGDHIISDVKPIITMWDLEVDFLEKYKINLLKLKNMNIKHLYPAHGDEIIDISKRVDEYLEIMDNKIEKIINVLEYENTWLTAYEVAQKLSSVEKFDKINERPKWFICTDMLCYLQHLRFTNKLKYKIENSKCLYYLREESDIS